MIYRGIYWLGAFVGFGSRIARVLYPAVSAMLPSALSGLQSGVHSVRYLHGGPLVRSTPSNVRRKQVGRPTKIERLSAPRPVADRVKTVELCAGHLVLGVMWIYMYPELKIARRVFKVQDRLLANALGWDRWYYTDVPFDGKSGIEDIVKAFHTEVSRQLDQRIVQAEKARTKERISQEQKAAQAAAAAPTAPATEPPKTGKSPAASAPRVEVAQSRSDTGSDSVAAAHKRQVKGDAVVGTVTHAGMTRKPNGDGSWYNTFCLTIHDGVREIPLFGTELARLIADQGIRAGEKINVVFMGKQKMSSEGEQPRFKNLYQVTRLNA